VYPPAATFQRASAAGEDRGRVWRRGDQEFFADGASHILAFAAASVFPQLHVVALRRHEDPTACHALASDGRWALDHAGWNHEAEILAEAARREPDSSWELVPVATDLGSYCLEHHARDRHEFAHDPWWRALAYLARFPPPPLVTLAWREAMPAEIPEQRSGPALTTSRR
jgi:hypothetical protein